MTRLRRVPDGSWIVAGRSGSGRFSVRSRFVFVGAGGVTRSNCSRKPVFPKRAAVLCFPSAHSSCTPTALMSCPATRSKSTVGRTWVPPPMSVPHLDKRVIDGHDSLMFGPPYPTFSTRLLKQGRLTDLFTTIRLGNVAPLIAVGIRNLGLVRYLVGQLLASRGRKLKQLRRFHPPTAHDGDWSLIDAGQRAQLIKPHPPQDRGGAGLRHRGRHRRRRYYRGFARRLARGGLDRSGCDGRTVEHMLPGPNTVLATYTRATDARSGAAGWRRGHGRTRRGCRWVMRSSPDGPAEASRRSRRNTSCPTSS